MALVEPKISTIKDDAGEHAITAANLASKAGGATQPVYINNDGEPAATTYALNATVPSDAVFTDTTYTLTSNATPTGGIPYIEEVSFTSGVLTLKTSYLHHNSSN